MIYRLLLFITAVTLALPLVGKSYAQSKVPDVASLPSNAFVLLRKDNAGGRRGGAVRYAASAKKFLLWGFMDGDPNFRQDNPSMPLPEHDVVYFDFDKRRWLDHVSIEWLHQQKVTNPLYFVPRCYHGLTSGSERSLFRAPAGYPKVTARPDLNITFDQVVYHPPSGSLIYFTGGLTTAYDVKTRRWRNLSPKQSPPPVLGGSLAYDPLHNELVLFGGGHVAEKLIEGPIRGYTCDWIYSFAKNSWRSCEMPDSPSPRMYSRLVCDTKNKVLVLFGGDGQSHFYGDTWIFDLKTRYWCEVKAAGPAPRAGHFTVYDPQSGLVLVGGGFNRKDLHDVWAYDAKKGNWRRLKGKVPSAPYINADFDPNNRLLLLVANDRAPGHGRTCDIHYAARSTYAYRFDPATAFLDEKPSKHSPMPKRPSGQSGRGSKVNPAHILTQKRRLKELAKNQWVLLADPARHAPIRTWGSATFDTHRDRIHIWGGGHCGYGGSDVDSYDVAKHAWISSDEHPEYPHRMWARGVRLAGVTFTCKPWTTHGRRIYAYDPTSRKVIAVRKVLLTTGYVPDGMKDFPGKPQARVDAKVKPPTSYSKYATWMFDPDSGRWNIVGPAPLGVDTLVTTKHGVMGVNVNWPTRLKDSGYMLAWNSETEPIDYAVFHFDSKLKKWHRLGKPQQCPQNLYEMTSLAYDSKRDRLLLHGGGEKRDELWAFNLKTHRWQNLKPKVFAGGEPPECMREMVYLPDQDVILTYGRTSKKELGPALWSYQAGRNVWQRISIGQPHGVSARVAGGQNRALVYDPGRKIVYLVLGPTNRSKSMVHALRFE